MGIRNFACFRTSGKSLVVRNALDAIPVDGSYVGWLTEFDFPLEMFRGKAVIKARSWTTFCEPMFGGGWQRILLDHPIVATDLTYLAYPPDENRLEPNAFSSGTRLDHYQWSVWTKTSVKRFRRVAWQSSFIRKTYYTAAPQFNVRELMALVQGAWSDAGDQAGGHAVFDFLSDTEEFGRLLTRPQWLPRTREEMIEAANATIREQAGREIEHAESATDTPEEEDRWR